MTKLGTTDKKSDMCDTRNNTIIIHIFNRVKVFGLNKKFKKVKKSILKIFIYWKLIQNKYSANLKIYTG